MMTQVSQPRGLCVVSSVQRSRTRRARAPLNVVSAQQSDGGIQKVGSRMNVTRRFGIAVDADGGGPGLTIHDYVRLPAESYNVLDSKAVTRIDDKSFRVTTGMQKMLLFTAEPTGVIEIEVLPDGVSQRLHSAELLPPKEKPHKAIAEINRMMGDLQLTNAITASEGPSGDTLLQCQLTLKGSFTEGVFAKVPEERLNSLMGWALGMAMPWFLTKLRQDYTLWYQRQDRRQATSSGDMNQLAKELAAGGRGQLPKGVVELPPVVLGQGSAAGAIEDAGEAIAPA